MKPFYSQKRFQTLFDDFQINPGIGSEPEISYSISFKYRKIKQTNFWFSYSLQLLIPRYTHTYAHVLYFSYIYFKPPIKITLNRAILNDPNRFFFPLQRSREEASARFHSRSPENWSFNCFQRFRTVLHQIIYIYILM